jgi:hypothetical protein
VTVNARLVSIDEPHAPPEQRGLFALIAEGGGTLAVGFLEPDGSPLLAFEPGDCVPLCFRVKGGVRE